jgi:ATP-dependent DNA helicase RecQ
VSGVGQIKYQKYGEAFLAVTRAAAPQRAPALAVPRRGARPVRQPGELAPTQQETLALFREGLGVRAIALARRLSTGTITTQLATLILEGHIEDISPLVPPETMQRIEAIVGDGPVGPLGPLREQLGGDVPYEELHLARAYLTRCAR